MKVTVIPTVIGALGTVLKFLDGILKSWKSEDNRDYLNYSIVEIGQNIEKNLGPVLENNTHKLLWDFDIHTDHLISARRPDLIIINKKKIAKLSTLLSRLNTE